MLFWVSRFHLPEFANFFDLYGFIYPLLMWSTAIEQWQWFINAGNKLKHLSLWCNAKIHRITTAWKMSVFWVFLVYISPHLDWIRRDTPYLSTFSPNEGKYGPEKLRIQTLFTQCTALILSCIMSKNGQKHFKKLMVFTPQEF